MGKFLAHYGLTSLADLDDKVCLLDDNKEFRRAEQFADPALAKELKAVKDSNSIKIERLRLIDAIRQITEKKAVREAMQLMAECTSESYDKAIALFDMLLESKCINAKKCRNYKRDALTQYTALKFLRETLDVCSRETIFSGDPYGRMFPNQLSALNTLSEAGFVEKHPNGYCWPGAKEEKERLQQEAEEQRQKQIRQQAAYDNACAEMDRQIQEDIATITAPITDEYDSKIRGVQRELDEAIGDTDRERESIQRQISDLRSQQSALGFFKGKEKRALQAQIDEAQSRLSAVPSQQDIQSRYQPMINQINADKQAAISQATEDIKSKYTLPKLEDFAEV